jgi:hypothetical protein
LVGCRPCCARVHLPPEQLQMSRQQGQVQAGALRTCRGGGGGGGGWLRPRRVTTATHGPMYKRAPPGCSSPRAALEHRPSGRRRAHLVDVLAHAQEQAGAAPVAAPRAAAGALRLDVDRLLPAAARPQAVTARLPARPCRAGGPVASAAASRPAGPHLQKWQLLQPLSQLLPCTSLHSTLLPWSGNTRLASQRTSRLRCSGP